MIIKKKKSSTKADQKKWLNGNARFLRPTDSTATAGNHYHFLRVVDDFEDNYEIEPTNLWRKLKYKVVGK